MKVLLVYPPLRDPTRPHQSLPLHVAVVNAAGIGEAHIEDANINFWNECLSVEQIRSSMHAIGCKLERVVQTEGANDQVIELKTIAAYGQRIIGKIEEAKRTLRSRQSFLDNKKYTNAINLIRLALRVVSAQWSPSRIDFISFNSKFSPNSRRDLEMIVSASGQNPFIDFFRRTTIRRIQTEGIGLVKISIVYSGQVIPGLTLAHWIKQEVPDVHVTLGGSLVCVLAERLRCWPWLFKQIDSFITDKPIPYDSEYGEHSLSALVAALAAKQNLNAVPGLTYRDSNSREILANPCQSVSDLSLLPTPCYDEIPWNSYLSPDRILPLSMSRGCTWNRCGFCGHTGDYYCRSTKQALHDIHELKKRHDIDYFYLCDDEAAAGSIRGFARALLGNGIDCRWHWMLRPGQDYNLDDCHTFFASGCRSVFVGLESAAPRIIDMIDNRANLQSMGNLVQHLANARIGVRSFSIVGFPTEEEHEAEKTYTFLRNHLTYLRLAHIQPFYLAAQSKMHLHPQDYGIAEIIKPTVDDLAPHIVFRAKSGMTHEDAVTWAQHHQEKLLDEINATHEGSNLHLFPLMSGHGLLKLAAEN